VLKLVTVIFLCYISVPKRVKETGNDEQLTSEGLWSWDNSEVLCNKYEFSTKEIDIIDCPDGMARVKRVAV
jgi:hypothetical protein